MITIFLDGKPTTEDRVISLAMNEYGYRPRYRPNLHDAVLAIHSHPDRRQRVTTSLRGD